MQKIQDIGTQVDAIVQRQQQLREEINSNGNISGQQGSNAADATSSSTEEAELRLKQRQQWRKGCLTHNEELMKKLEMLDAVEGNEEDRLARRQLVRRIQSHI